MPERGDRPCQTLTRHALKGCWLWTCYALPPISSGLGKELAQICITPEILLGETFPFADCFPALSKYFP
jgi:hypothetical protein